MVWVASDGSVAGILGISDPIKKTTPGAIKALHELGLKVIMATGAGWDCQGDCAQPGCNEKYPAKIYFSPLFTTR